MNVPGFTAEVSLFESRGHYQFAESQDGPISRGLVPQLKKTDLPNASCGKDPVFGNVICVECTTGPFPVCKTYVCDQSGNNCKQTSRLNRHLLMGPLSATANVFRG
jgi:hypothetical protein